MPPFAIRSAFPILTVRDVARSLAFYRDLLGFDLAYRWPEAAPFAFATVARGGTEIGFGAGGDPEAGEPPAADGPKPPVALSMAVDDVDAAVAWLAERGVVVLAPPEDQPCGSGWPGSPTRTATG